MTFEEATLNTFTATCDAIVVAWVSSPIEAALLDRWLGDHRRRTPHIDVVVVELAPGAPSPAQLDELVSHLSGSRHRLVVPVRICWMPTGSQTDRSIIKVLLAGRDPYRPNTRRQRQIMRTDPSRARVVAAEPASIGELDQAWRATTGDLTPRDFAAYVLRRARLALARVEYRLLGPEYKSPRLVKPEMLSSARFRDGLRDIPGATLEEAGDILDEMATGWSRLSVDFIPWLGRLIFQRGFDRCIDYDAGQVTELTAALQIAPAALLFSHRSNLDSLVMAVAMKDNRLPRAHLFGGINMAISLLGPVMRRSGVIFIRRNIADNDLYKYVLKQYVGYLVEKRFNLTWSIEGTRSRTGKMLPPRLGLLRYVVDSYADARSDDILLQPVSISYDQLHETSEYAAYARGAVKKPEGITWFVNFVRAQGSRHYGKIYVRFPPAVSLQSSLGSPHDHRSGDRDSTRLALQKVAFEVAWRILNATPINATALICTILLSAHGSAMTLPHIHTAANELLDFLERKSAPMTDSALRLRSHQGVASALDALASGHPVTRIDGGWNPVWCIAIEQQHEAAFYRNTISHVFLETAIAELALAHAARSESDPLQAFWHQTGWLRDVLKFEFYFADSAAFRTNIDDELTRLGDWQAAVAQGASAIGAALDRKRPMMAPSTLRPFLEAYWIVADVLAESETTLSGADLVTRSLGVGRQYFAQGRLRSNESVSALLFSTAAKVAADRNLLSGADVGLRRTTFCAQMTAVLADLDTLETTTTSGAADH